MSRGGYRPGSGRPKGAISKKRKSKGTERAPRSPKIPQDIIDDATEANMMPLDYMLKVLNDPNEADKARKDRMAIAAAPFCHARKGEGAGKKEEKADRAKAAAGGKFASMGDRLRVVK